MRLIKNLLALVVLALGALWSLQGSGLVGGSFMTGQSQWLYRYHHCAGRPGRPGVGEPFAPLTLEPPQGWRRFGRPANVRPPQTSISCFAPTLGKSMLRIAEDLKTGPCIRG